LIVTDAGSSAGAETMMVLFGGLSSTTTLWPSFGPLLPMASS